MSRLNVTLSQMGVPLSGIEMSLVGLELELSQDANTLDRQLSCDQVCGNQVLPLSRDEAVQKSNKGDGNARLRSGEVCKFWMLGLVGKVNAI